MDIVTNIAAFIDAAFSMALLGAIIVSTAVSILR